MKKKKITDKVVSDWFERNDAELCQDLKNGGFVLFYGIFKRTGKDPHELVHSAIREERK